MQNVSIPVMKMSSASGLRPLPRPGGSSLDPTFCSLALRTRHKARRSAARSPSLLNHHFKSSRPSVADPGEWR